MITRAITTAGLLTTLFIGALTGYNDPPDSFLVEQEDGLIFRDSFDRVPSDTVGNGWSQAGEVEVGAYYLELEESGVILHDDFERTVGSTVGNGWSCTGTNADCDLRDYYFSLGSSTAANTVTVASLPDGWWMQQAGQSGTRVYEVDGSIELYPTLCEDEDFELGKTVTLKTIMSIDCESALTYHALNSVALSLCGDLEQNMTNCSSGLNALKRFDMGPPTTEKPGAVLSRLISRNALYYYSMWGTAYQYGQYPTWANTAINSLLRNSDITVSGSATLSDFNEEFVSVLAGVSRGDEKLRLYSDSSGSWSEMGTAASVAGVEWGEMSLTQLSAGSGELLVGEVYWLAAIDVRIKGLPTGYSAQAQGHPSTRAIAQNGVAYVNPGPYYELTFPLQIYDAQSILVAKVMATRGDNWQLNEGNYLLTFPTSATPSGQASVYRTELSVADSAEPQMIYLEIEQLDLSLPDASLTVYAGAATSPDGGLSVGWYGGASYTAAVTLTIDPGADLSISDSKTTDGLPVAIAAGIDRAGLLKLYWRIGDVWSLVGSVSTSGATWDAVYPYFGLTSINARAVITALNLTRALDIEVGGLPDGYSIQVPTNPSGYAEETEGTARLDPGQFAAGGVRLELRNAQGNSVPIGGKAVGVHPGSTLELIE
jgi:hypothetical protein